MIKRLVLLSIACAALGAAQAPAGMWLCAGDYGAVEFWERIQDIARSGVEVTPEIMAQAAKAKGCARVTSLALRPVGEGHTPGSVLLANGEKMSAGPRLDTLRSTCPILACGSRGKEAANDDDYQAGLRAAQASATVKQVERHSTRFWACIRLSVAQTKSW